jgi:hypothetical protein
VYANKFAGSSFNSIVLVDPDTLVANETTPIVVSADVGGTIINKFVVNRINSLVAIGGVSKIEIWNYNLQTKVATVTIPELSLFDLAYENNELLWSAISTNAGGISLVKINYKLNTPEVYTQLEDGSSPDLSAGLAYDSKRKNLAIFRQRTEATDGAAQHVLEIYKPFSLATNLTGAVPVQRIIKGKSATMVAHLIGDRGEVGQVKPVTVTNSGDGTIINPTVTPRSNGAVAFQYQAGDFPGTDVITVEADI